MIQIQQKYQTAGQNYACKEIKRLNQNRMIIGEIPSNEFTSFGDKIMQSPPTNRVYDHHSDVYSVDEIVGFINQMVPNFFKEINNLNEFQEFQIPKYSPKLIYATTQGQVPQVVKQLGVSFFQRFDMGCVEDLAQSVVNRLEVSKYPSLMVLKHNFQTDKLEIFPYNSHDFSEDLYFKIKHFLQKHALKEIRRDRVFHLIKASKQNQIITVDTQADLKQAYNRIQGWIFVSQGPSSSKLRQLKQKYGQYYSYIHYYKPQQVSDELFLYNSRSDIKYIYDDNAVQYRSMSSQQFQSNSTLWLKKDYVVLGARYQYGHICALIDQALFAGLTQCFIIDENYYEDVTKILGVKFKYGFIVTTQKNSGDKVRGNDITNADYDEVYSLLEYSTRMKVKDIIDDFMENPVKDITQTVQLQQLCRQPFKKCIIYFEQKNKEKTNREYLQIQARNFANEYKIFSVDLSCNRHILQQIFQLEGKHNGMIAYHPRENKYVFLKAKINRSVIKKFLQINNEQRKSLPFKQFSNQKLILKGCREDNLINEQHNDKKQQQNKFTNEL